MQTKYFFALLILILGLNGCGGRKNRTEPKQTHKPTTDMPTHDSKTTKVSFFDEDASGFEDVETFVLDEESNAPQPAQANTTLAWQESAATPAGHERVVYFNYDSSRPREDQQPNLAMAKESVKEWANQGHKVVFKGHACRYHGEPAYNTALSNQRAHDLAMEITKDLGIAKEMVQCFGVGNEEPMVYDDTLEGNAPNRRVEIYSLAV